MVWRAFYGRWPCFHRRRRGEFHGARCGLREDSVALSVRCVGLRLTHELCNGWQAIRGHRGGHDAFRVRPTLRVVEGRVRDYSATPMCEPSRARTGLMTRCKGSGSLGPSRHAGKRSRCALNTESSLLAFAALSTFCPSGTGGLSLLTASGAKLG